MKPEDELDLGALFDEIYLEEGKSFSDAIKETYTEQISLQERRINHLQAKIDELMLEYCPDEMTEEQMENWGKHQQPSSSSSLLALCKNATSDNLFKNS